MFTIGKPEANKTFDLVPEGKYTGKVVKTEIRNTNSGYKSLSLQIKLDGGNRSTFDSILLNHPKAAKVTADKINRLMTYGYQNPPTQIGSYDDLKEALDGVPVNITVKHKTDAEGKTRENVYYNETKPEQRVVFGAVKAASSGQVSW
jgi:hypothetical protein